MRGLRKTRRCAPLTHIPPSRAQERELQRQREKEHTELEKRATDLEAEVARLVEERNDEAGRRQGALEAMERMQQEMTQLTAALEQPAEGRPWNAATADAFRVKLRAEARRQREVLVRAALSSDDGDSGGGGGAKGSGGGGSRRVGLSPSGRRPSRVRGACRWRSR